MNGEGRKGEISELRTQLRQLAGSRATGVNDVKRELFKKIISYMTIGIDVSSLFSEMVMCSATSDLVLKKMCYLYVCNYASVNPELALLTINFLLKDCQDDDPMIRGLALRSLCGLRVKNLVEYLTSPLQKGLNDQNGYVRTNAVMGVLKLYHVSPSTCNENGFLDVLKVLLLRDPDPQVILNSLCSLQEILKKEISCKNQSAQKDYEHLFSKPVVYSLLNRIKGFSEWGQCIILEHIVNYIPADANEIFDVMNLLEDRLQHANSAVVLATTKVFLHLTLSMADVHQQVYERIKSPLLTLMGTSGSEQAFSVLSHLLLLASRAPMLFSGDYKHFFCRFSDPSSVKKLKLEILTLIANENNTYDIVSELTEYVADVDVSIARAAIRAVGKIALESYDINGVVDRLLQFLEMDTDYVTAETLVLVKNLVRKYPQWSEDCLSVVGNVSSTNVEDKNAKSALIWMLGEYGNHMSDSPYVLEKYVERWEEEESPEVRLELLTGISKLFFKRPPECQQILGKALAFGLADQNQDVHDRALLYYRLFQCGVREAEKVISPAKQPVSVFADTQSSEAKDRIFDEFNSLSVIYRKPSYSFLDKEHQGPGDIEIVPLSTPVGPDESEGSSQIPDLVSNSNDRGQPHGVSNGLLEGSGTQATLHATQSLLPDLDDIGGKEIVPVPSNTPPAVPSLDELLGLNIAPVPPPEPEPLPKLELVHKPALDAGTFQKKWGQLSIAETLNLTLSQEACEALTGPQALLKHMASQHILCMASGGVSPNFKFFFYAQRNSSSQSGFFLVELVINKASGVASAKVKAEDLSLVSTFFDVFTSTLKKFGTL